MSADVSWLLHPYTRANVMLLHHVTCRTSRAARQLVGGKKLARNEKPSLTNSSPRCSVSPMRSPPEKLHDPSYGTDALNAERPTFCSGLKILCQNRLVSGHKSCYCAILRYPQETTYPYDRDSRFSLDTATSQDTRKVGNLLATDTIASPRCTSPDPTASSTNHGLPKQRQLISLTCKIRVWSLQIDPHRAGFCHVFGPRE